MNKRFHVIDAVFCCLRCSDGMGGYVYREERVDLDQWLVGDKPVLCSGCGKHMMLTDDWGGVDFMVARDEVYGRMGWERRGKNLYFNPIPDVQRPDKGEILHEVTEMFSELPEGVRASEGGGREEV